MADPVETEYGISAAELLEAVSHRFRAKVALEGVVAEVQAHRKILAAYGAGLVDHFEVHDQDGYADFTLHLKGRAEPIRVECKNVRDSDEAYRDAGKIVAYKCETQKTRASKGDPLSRYYSPSQFEILAVCLGKKTRQWSQFMFVEVGHLSRHSTHSEKLAVMQRVPLPGSSNLAPWFDDLGKLLKEMSRRPA
ncbi:MAG: hypothetical protein FD180_928 [Planctomycetota bacterium]|nr:MAG: hypothetical protein FD180_928 [Planctomycetota bacterium]